MSIPYHAGKAPSIATVVSILVLLITCGILLVLILNRTDGLLVYTLDDAYIHMALAENILRGHYGVNLHEFSAPSSSILWPLLLAPFSAFGQFFDYVPFIINALCACLTAYLLVRVAYDSASIAGITLGWPALTAITIALLLATNAIGLVFLGMEHSLQLLLSVALVRALHQALATRAVPITLMCVAVAGPLVRYENLTLTAAALLVLTLHRHWKAVWITVASLTFSLGAFSCFLLSLGLEALPTSVLAKTSELPSGATVASLWDVLNANIFAPRGLILLGMAVVLCCCAFGLKPPLPRGPAPMRNLALGVAGALLAHLAVGRLGWYHRYEVYAWGAAIVTWILVVAAASRGFGPIFHRLPRLALIVMGLAVMATGSYSYVRDIGTIPLASFNIYRQQYQMRRIAFASQGPVAVNDLGLVSYRNSNYVLDLRGLASIHALRHRHKPPDPAWMQELCEHYGVPLAILWEGAFPWGFPPSWRKIGQFWYAGPIINQSGRLISVFVTDQDQTDRLRKVLQGITSWPPGVTLRILPG